MDQSVRSEMASAFAASRADTNSAAMLPPQRESALPVREADYVPTYSGFSSYTSYH
jgi:hypothetical protein